MTTESRKRIPLRVALLATIIGLICTLSLFGETSQAASSMEACEGKGCVECDPSVQECLPPPAPTPTPEPPAPTPTPTPEPTPTQQTATPTLARTGATPNLPWIALILSALGWGAWNKAQQRRA